MAVDHATDAPTPRSILGDLRSSIRTERRRVTAEIDAFDAFLDRVESIDPDPPAPTPRTVGGDGLRAVRSAYEQTVMGCDHYDADYGDTYAESVAAEFGPEIGTLLAGGSGLRPQLKTALLDRTQECRSEREHLIEMLDAESDSLDAVAPEFDAIATELREFPPCPDPDAPGSYGALEAEWRRLDTLAERVEELSDTRQRAIVAQRRRFHLPVDAPDVPAYLYGEFDDRYPLLSAFVRLQERVRTRRSERERAIARV